MRDLEEMTGARLGRYWKYTLKYVCPLLLTSFFVANMVRYTTGNPLSYTAWNKSTGTQVPAAYPMWAYFLIVLVCFFCLAAAPLGVVMKLSGKPDWFNHVMGKKVGKSTEMEVFA